MRMHGARLFAALRVAVGGTPARSAYLPSFRFSGGFAGPGESTTDRLTGLYDALPPRGVQDQPHAPRPYCVCRTRRWQQSHAPSRLMRAVVSPTLPKTGTKTGSLPMSRPVRSANAAQANRSCSDGDVPGRVFVPSRLGTIATTAATWWSRAATSITSPPPSDIPISTTRDASTVPRDRTSSAR
jgi:hypothetical protein